MARKFLSNLDLARNEIQNAVIQQLAAAPSSPVQGQIYYNTTDDNLYVYDGAGWVDLTVQGGGSGDVSSDTATSVDSEIALFAGTDGKTIKRATTTGILKGTSGVIGAATAGTDYTSPSSTETFTNKTLDANGVGNSITNLETADFATNVVDNDSTLAANANNRLSTQQAVKGYVDNKVDGISWKPAVRAATTTSIANLSSASTTQDGVTLVAGDRLLVKNGASPDGVAAVSDAYNGIYVVGTVTTGTAPLTRASDANTGAELVNATVMVQEGTANADTQWTVSTNAPITVDTTAITWAQKDSGALPQATTTTAGKVELATAAEAEARTDGTLAATPLSLANFPVKKTFTVGDGTATSIALTHNLGTKEVITQVRQAADDAVVECDIVNTSTTVTTLNFAVAPAASAIKAVVMG